MLPDDPRHGTYAGWHTHIREGSPICEPCREARCEYNRKLSKDHRLGRKRLYPVADLARHMHRLNRSGLTWRQIAALANVTEHTVRRAAGIDPEKRAHVNIGTARKLALIRPLGAHDDRPTALGCRRRLQSLVASGYTYSALAPMVGMTRTNLTTFVRDVRVEGPQRTVRAQTWERVTATYEALHMTPGPSERARRYARAKGWPPPWAWDDIDNDRDADPTGYVRRTKGDAA